MHSQDNRIEENRFQSSVRLLAEHYGMLSQLDQTVEECAELIQAINKLKRAVKSNNNLDAIQRAEENIAEEICDVFLTTMQIQYLLNIESKEIENIVEKKIKRQLKRIEDEKK